MASQVGAEPPFPVSELTMTICYRGIPERIWSSEHSDHGRDMPQQWVMESADPRFVGSGGDIVNWNINITTMTGVSWGTYELLNDNAVDGWQGKWQGKLRPSDPLIIKDDGIPVWLFEGRGEGHGFGAYEGLQEHFEVHQTVSLYPTEAAALLEVPCVTGNTLDGQVYVMQNHIPLLSPVRPNNEQTVVAQGATCQRFRGKGFNPG